MAIIAYNELLEFALIADHIMDSGRAFGEPELYSGSVRFAQNLFADGRQFIGSDQV